MPSTHQRQVIREKVVALLKAGTTSAGQRVYETRAIPVGRPELPAIAVYTKSESVTADESAPRVLTRHMDLTIEACVEVGSNPDDAMDAICLQIERIMHADETLGAECIYSVLDNTSLDVSNEGQKYIGVATLTYAVEFETYAPDSDDVILDDLVTVDTKTNLDNAQEAANQAEDHLTDLDDP